MLIAIKEACLYVADLDSTRKFYEGTLGLTLHSQVKNSHVFFKVGSSMLLCFLNEAAKNQTSLPPHFAYGNIHFAFEIEAGNYEGFKEQLLAKGIEIEHEHTWKNNIKSFYFRDPDNHLVEVLMPGVWE